MFFIYGNALERTKKMSTNACKLLALALMLIDHIGEFIPNMPIFLRILGRASAPIFIFCTAWGFYYTHDKKIYLLRMYLCSAGMGILDFILNISIQNPYQLVTNNIFSTLFVICLFAYLWEKQPIAKAALTTLFVVGNLGLWFVVMFFVGMTGNTLLLSAASGCLPNLFTCEGSIPIFLMGLVFVFCKEQKQSLWKGYTIYCAIYFCLTLLGYWGSGIPLGTYLFTIDIQWLQILSLPILLLYNGSKGRQMKYFFYLFYPLHITALYYIGNLLF